MFNEGSLLAVVDIGLLVVIPMVVTAAVTVIGCTDFFGGGFERACLVLSLTLPCICRPGLPLPLNSSVYELTTSGDGGVEDAEGFISVIDKIQI